MGLFDRLIGRAKAGDKPALPAPVARDDKALAWMRKFDDIVASCQMPGLRTTAGTPPDAVLAALLPALTSNLGYVETVYQGLWTGFHLLKGIPTEGIGQGLAVCAACQQPNFLVSSATSGQRMNCSKCGRPVEYHFIVFSPAVGEQIRALFEQHSVCLDRMTRAGDLEDREDWAGALALYRESEAVCRELGNRPVLAEVLKLVGGVLDTQKDREAALAAYAECQQLYEETGHRAGVADAITNRAGVLMGKRDLGLAEVLLDQAEDLGRDLDDSPKAQSTLASALSTRTYLYCCRAATIPLALAPAQEACDIHTRVARQPGLETFRRIGEQTVAFAKQMQAKLGEGPAPLRARQADAMKRGDKAGALACALELEKLYRAVQDFESLRGCLNEQLSLLFANGKIAEALKACEGLESICRLLPGSEDGLAAALANQAQILELLEEKDQARVKAAEAEALNRELTALRESLPGLKAQADEAAKKNDADAALRCQQQIAAACARLGKRMEGFESVEAQAAIRAQRGETAAALELHERAEGLARELGNLPLAMQALLGQANLLAAVGDAGRAMHRLTRAAAGWNELAALFVSTNISPEMQAHLPYVLKERQAALVRLRAFGDSLADAGLAPLAIRAYRKTIALRQPALEQCPADHRLCLEHVADLDELGVSLMKSGEQKEGLHFARQAFELLERLDGRDPAGRAGREGIRNEIVGHLGTVPK